jgi:hypothetical protein
MLFGRGRGETGWMGACGSLGPSGRRCWGRQTQGVVAMGGAGHAACLSWAWGGRDGLRDDLGACGLVGIIGRGFVSVNGALRSTKTQQRQFMRARVLRAVASIHAAALASYHRQQVRSLRASPGGVLVACGVELGKRSARWRSAPTKTYPSDGLGASASLTLGAMTLTRS